MTRWMLLGVTLVIASAAGAQATAGDPVVEPPNTPVGVALGEFLTAYNRADSSALRAFYRKYGLDRAMDAVLSRRQATGGYDLVASRRLVRDSSSSWPASAPRAV